MADWETVRALALGLPEVEEEASGRRGYRIRGKLFAWRSRERDGSTLALRVDRDEKQLMLEGRPDLYFQTPHVYFTSPHYNGYPAVQVRVERVDPDELAQRLEDAWLIQAPKRLAAEHVARSEG